MLIAGWGKDYSARGSIVSNLACSRCGASGTVVWLLVQEAKRASLYFVPVARWGKRFLLLCSTCHAGAVIPAQRANELLLLLENQQEIDDALLRSLLSGEPIQLRPD